MAKIENPPTLARSWWLPSSLPVITLEDDRFRILKLRCHYMLTLPSKLKVNPVALSIQPRSKPAVADPEGYETERPLKLQKIKRNIQIGINSLQVQARQLCSPN